MAGIGSHTKPNRGMTDDWITPREIIDALGGPDSFDLDPCICTPQPWPTAKEMWTERGLNRKWFGRTWLNPPYGQQTIQWLEALAEHGNGIALIFARTETEMFYDYGWCRASSMLFLKGRLFFHYPDPTNPDHCFSGGSHEWRRREPDNPNNKAEWCHLCGKAKANAGGPSVLIAFGEQNTQSLRDSRLPGALVTGFEIG